MRRRSCFFFRVSFLSGGITSEQDLPRPCDNNSLIQMYNQCFWTEKRSQIVLKQRSAGQEANALVRLCSVSVVANEIYSAGLKKGEQKKVSNFRLHQPSVNDTLHALVEEINRTVPEKQKKKLKLCFVQQKNRCLLRKTHSTSLCLRILSNLFFPQGANACKLMQGSYFCWICCCQSLQLRSNKMQHFPPIFDLRQRFRDSFLLVRVQHKIWGWGGFLVFVSATSGDVFIALRSHTGVLFSFNAAIRTGLGRRASLFFDY